MDRSRRLIKKIIVQERPDVTKDLTMANKNTMRRFALESYDDWTLKYILECINKNPDDSVEYILENLIKQFDDMACGGHKMFSIAYDATVMIYDIYCLERSKI